jgi:predicted nucleotidyltransferase
MQMKSAKHIQDFLNAFVNWASTQEDVQGIALVGSYARDEARDDSDIDLVLLTKKMQQYLENVKWIERFGVVEKHQVEDYGKLISIRVWYESEVEVEYGITVSAPPNLAVSSTGCPVRLHYKCEIRIRLGGGNGHVMIIPLVGCTLC